VFFIFRVLDRWTRNLCYLLSALTPMIHQSVTVDKPELPPYDSAPTIHSWQSIHI
jgi:hypothetical protein